MVAFERVRVFQAFRHLRDDLVQARQHPAIEQVVALRGGAFRVLRVESPVLGRHPAIQVGVGDQEAVHIPQRDQELAAGFIAAVVAEEQVVFGFVGAVQPAHHIHAHLVGGFVELDRVAPAFVHRAPVFGQQRAVAEVLQEGRAVCPPRSPSPAGCRTSCGTARGRIR